MGGEWRGKGKGREDGRRLRTSGLMDVGLSTMLDVGVIQPSRHLYFLGCVSQESS